MAKKLADIKNTIEAREQDFIKYLYTELNSEVVYFLDLISSRTNTYLFSGIIRNYFLGNYIIRDIDLVVESDRLIYDIINHYHHRKNSFGGYKLRVGDMEVDLWSADKTWAFNNHQTILDFGLEKHLPDTAFFNFSSVMYSINEHRFYFTDAFLKFLRDKEIDVVLVPNANKQLCLVNTFYYSDKYNLKISDRLKEIMRRIYSRESPDYSMVQQKHFGKVLYNNEEIYRRIIALPI